MKGIDGIRDLRLAVLNKLVSKVPPNPNLFFSGLFPTVNYESKRIEWEIEYGSTGMSPFVVPQADTPKIGLDGKAKGVAEAAYSKEGIDYDWEFLNNLRELGTDRTLASPQRELAKGVRKLTNRMRRRREWSIAKMITDGSLAYHDVDGVKFTVNYGLPSDHVVTLADAYKWGTGTLRNPINDLDDAKEVLSEDAGIDVIPYVMMNTTTMKLLKRDESIQGMLRKDSFGNGDLFTSNPAKVLGELLGVGMIYIYDGYWETDAILTAAVTAGGGASYTVYVDNASDIEAGGKVTFHRFDPNKKTTDTDYYEEEVVESVDIGAGTFTVVAGPSVAFKVGDRVRIRKKFISDNKVVMFAPTVDGEPIAEVMQAPFGFEKHYGLYLDRNVTWDPEVMTLRAQDSYLPVLYKPEAIYTLTVA